MPRRRQESALEHVAIFDEAQRAWNHEKTADFMRRKKKLAGFNQSEPEFLISCLDRHTDWAVVICLVGGGRKSTRAKRGSANGCERSSKLSALEGVLHPTADTTRNMVPVESSSTCATELVCGSAESAPFDAPVRSFRAEQVSQLVKQILDLDVTAARPTLGHVSAAYPLVLTRHRDSARRWLRTRARGSERYGIVVEAERLKPHALDVKTPVNPIHWFLNDKNDVRSSYYLEESRRSSLFRVWSSTGPALCGTRTSSRAADWDHWASAATDGTDPPRDRQTYQKNAYRSS